MHSEKNNQKVYLSRCQVDTPDEIIKGMWNLLYKKRATPGTVLDLGAGDGRFSLHGKYKKYTGYEVDKKRIKSINLPKNANLVEKCAFDTSGKYDICIGNPPYVRHHDMDRKWRTSVIEKLESESNIKIDARSNAFTLFMLKAILSTKDNGIVVLLVPYEWISRPASLWLRDYLQLKKWQVEVYKFKDKLFERVLTTASIVIIDKSIEGKSWSYYTIDKSFNFKKNRLPTGSNQKIISYSKRGSSSFAQRGLSPGGQKIFCLTEGERLHYGLDRSIDVVPCVTSLKDINLGTGILDEKNFKEHFIQQGKRCWLLISTPKPSKQLLAYLGKVPKEDRNNYTCNHQQPWWNYKPHQPAAIIYSSSFTAWGPKFVENKINAIALGSVHGIHDVQKSKIKNLLKELSSINFEKQIIHHSGSLKKIEVNQMNTILQEITEIGK